MVSGQEELDWLFPDAVEREVVERSTLNIPDDPDVPDPGTPDVIPKPKTLQVPYGTYTLVLNGDEKPHRTIRVSSWNTRPGYSVFAMLTGPDNSLDFTGFGEQKGDNQFHIWRKFGDRAAWLEAGRALVLMVSDPEAMEAAGIIYAEKSKRCRRCYHPLSVPASLHRGYGPDCAEEMGLI
jgi:hypothetical protein